MPKKNPTPDVIDENAVENPEAPDRRGGGTGNASGTDFHALAMVVAAVHMLRGTKIGWLDKIASDIPVAVKAETGGPGDDIGLELKDGATVEVQAKKNLQKGAELWDALEALVDGISDGLINYGVLAVAPDSSGTIKYKLASDIINIGNDAHDDLSDIGKGWLERLNSSGRMTEHCASIRIKTLSLLESEDADRRHAVEILRHICADPDRAEDALNLMYRDAIALMRSRGRWTLPSVTKLLRSQGIVSKEDTSPVGVLTKLVAWVESTRGRYSLPGAKSSLAIETMLQPRLVATPLVTPHASDAMDALEQYHSRTTDSSGADTFTGEWAGQFIRLNVVVAGPGMGKSTLADRLCWEYARLGYPVLKVSLKRIAAAMLAGETCEAAIEQHGLDGSGIDASRLRAVGIERLIVIADGLDEAGALHDDVAAGLVAYAAGHHQTTMVVTTRPIGYETARLADWRHYRLEPPFEKDGQKNLGQLISVSQGLAQDDAGCLRQAERELSATPARDAIVTSPLMTGMAATLIIRDARLPATKAGIYESMISLFEDRDTDISEELTSLEAKRILDIVGWMLTENPLLAWPDLETAACRVLARDLGRTPMAVAPLFNRGFRHWERAGLIEKVHHVGVELVTFVHKTFGEFSAARFLRDMDVDRLSKLERIVDIPALGEVVSFAGGIGLGSDLAQLYIDRRGSGTEGQFERALTLVADREAHIDDARVVEIADIAFSIVATGANDRFSIGERLANLAKARSGLMGPYVQAHLDDPNGDIRLVAWAAAVAAGSQYYETSRLDAMLEEFTKLVLSGETPRAGGILANRLGKDVDLVQSIALAALRAKPTDEMADFVDIRLSDRPFTNYSFHSAVQGLLISMGVTEPKFSAARRHSSASMALSLFSNPGDRWTRAANRALRALAQAVALTPTPSGYVSAPTLSPYLQFSALFKLADPGSVEASDVFKWEADYDEEAVSHTIRSFVAISRIDAAQLAAEASEIVQRLDADPDGAPFSVKLGDPDIPTPDWTLAAALTMDRKKLEEAFHHGSSWLMVIAANLLMGTSADLEECARLLTRSRGDALFYATQIVAAHLDRPTWQKQLIARAQNGPSNGVEHILSALASSDKLPPAIEQLVETGMRSEESVILAAAARLGLAWLEAGGAIDRELARSAYRGWIQRDRDAKGSRLVTTAREDLLKLLIAGQSLDDEQLEAALSDPDQSVREMAALLKEAKIVA